jgi:2-phosphosulfolactate phosphatase
MKHLEVLFSPAEFAALAQRDLSNTICVVFDVLRATSTMVTALANGAEAVIPVEGIAEALAVRKRQSDVLLGGERDGVRITSELTGSIDFDLGNSPREYTRDKVQGRTIVITTTNGTRALRACAHAKLVLAASFLNLRATAERLEHGADLLLICSGTYEEAAYEDSLGAGALCDLVWSRYAGEAIADSALMARRLYRLEQKDLLAGLEQSRNGTRLLQKPELKEDVAFCARRDVVVLAAGLSKEGRLIKV